MPDPNEDAIKAAQAAAAASKNNGGNQPETPPKAGEVVPTGTTPSGEKQDGEGDAYAQELARITKERDAAINASSSKGDALAAEREAKKKAEAEIEKLKGGATGFSREEAAELIKEKLEAALIDRDAALLAKAEARAERVASGDRLNRLVESASDNTNERNLIRHHLEHSIKPSGDLAADVDNARLLANKRILQVAAQTKGNEQANNEAVARLFASRPGTARDTTSSPYTPETEQLAKILGVDVKKYGPKTYQPKT